LSDRTAGETNVVTTDLRDAEETLAIIDDTVEADNTVLGEILAEAPIDDELQINQMNQIPI
jgi:hypothetical protein